jgi:hypothetical protein
MQRPDATQVAGYGTWHSLGRQVRKGEHGIKILAPMVCGAEKLTVTNVATGEKTEMESASHLRFRVVNVFDVEQTFGEDLPRGCWLARLLTVCGRLWRLRSGRRAARSSVPTARLQTAATRLKRGR